MIETRDQAEAFLDDRIGQGVKPGLERITGLLAFLGDPQTTYPSIHIAGTNGKTTVARMVQQILGSHGLATGGFTSPHLDVVEDRYTLHGARIDADRFTQAVRDLAWFVEGYERDADTPVTYFEVTAALAFALFAEGPVDVAIVEVGLGGRLDATNVLDADVSVITGIDFDHMEFLGDTIGAIAAEKAAIVKDEGTLVTGLLPGEALEAVGERVDEVGATWIRWGRDFDVIEATVGVGGWQCSLAGVFDEYRELFLPIHGRHQVDNLATAVATAEMFIGRALDPDLLLLAVASMRSPGRIEVVGRRPVVVLDGAHNQQGIDGLATALDTEFPPMQWDLVLGLRGPRDVGALLVPMKGRIRHVHTATLADPDAQAAETLAEASAGVLGVEATAYDSAVDALAGATDAAGPDGGVVAMGSLYLVGELRGSFDLPDDASAEAHLRFEAERDVDDEELDDLSEDDA